MDKFQKRAHRTTIFLWKSSVLRFFSERHQTKPNYTRRKKITHNMGKIENRYPAHFATLTFLLLLPRRSVRVVSLSPFAHFIHSPRPVSQSDILWETFKNFFCSLAVSDSRPCMCVRSFVQSVHWGRNNFACCVFFRRGRKFFQIWANSVPSGLSGQVPGCNFRFVPSRVGSVGGH